jgi:hypothetical protein
MKEWFTGGAIVIAAVALAWACAASSDAVAPMLATFAALLPLAWVFLPTTGSVAREIPPPRFSAEKLLSANRTR